MSEYAGLEFQICLPRRRATGEWFRALFHHLWTHGFSFGPTANTTWEAELDASGCAFVLNDGDTASGTLTAFIAGASAVTNSFIDVSNGVSPLQMGFAVADPLGDSRSDTPTTQLSYVSLWTNKYDSSPPGERDRPYLHAYNAFIHTCALLCEALDPLYGLGYDLYQTRDQAGQDALASLEESAAPDLLAGRLPNVSAWFRSEPLQYIAPAYVTPERTLLWLTPSRVSIQRLATGGLFIVPTMAPYTYEDAIAHAALARGKRLALLIARAQHGMATPAPTDMELALARSDAMSAFTRAITIFASVNDEEGERLARFALVQLED